MKPRAFYTALGLLSLAIVLTAALGLRREPVVVATHIEHLPVQIGDFTGRAGRYDDKVYAVLNADRHLYRHYRSGAGDRVDLYIGYYGTAKGGRSAHNPNACLPGAGWAIISDQTANLAGAGGDARPIRELIAVRDGQYLTLYHWYQVNRNEVAANGLRQNLLRFKNRLLRNRDDGAFVQISVFSTRDAQAQAENIGLNFARQINRLLPDYWPEER